MPFKWRLKKTRKYDISTKNLFIVGVYLLDNAYLECTLNAESTGQECLNSIAQRIELSENSYFGLRYVTKKLHFHWVDLEKPLKKQLDKYAQPASHCHSLYFGVMFYVIGAHKIPDEVARYHYYLQLKNDIIDGRVPCSADQAIRLAAYSLQAEFGDYEPDKYAAEDYLLFPKTMMQDESMAAELMSEAIAGHASLQGVPPVRAELQYVKEVQMMDGYGAEYYSAKDESRKDLYLGTSYAGIFARYVDGQSTVYYKWAEIAKVTQNKKTLEIDTPKSSVQFQLEDTDTAKYVSRLAQLQTQFYKSSKGSLSTSLTDISLAEEFEGQSYMDAQQVYIPPTDLSHSSQELGHSQTSLTHMQEQRYAQDILQSSQQSLESSESQHQQLQQQFQHHHHHPHHQLAGMEGEMTMGNGLYHQQIMRHESLTPTPEGDPVYVNRAALLPAYRPSPDYDTVMQQRMFQQHHPTQPLPQPHPQPHFDEITPHLGAAQVYVHPDGMAYSQPEISQNMAAFRDEHGNYANVDALRNYSHSIYANIFQDSHGYYTGRAGDRANNLAVHPTYSSPELNTAELHQQEVFATGEFSAQEAMAYHFRPPPPYPRTSSSTPDLAGQTTSNPISDQPDIILQNLAMERAGPHDLITQSQLDRSIDDLSKFQLNTAYSTSGIQIPFTNATDMTPMVNNTPVENVTTSVDSSQQFAGGDNGENPTDNAISPNSSSQSSHPQNDLSLLAENNGKILSDDQEDTSSEHSYSTFHAKESDESSEDEGARPKSVQAKEESKIQIRMFTPQEAPPPSKLKEEATLRESFRRMKIARTGSLNKETPGLRRSSLRGLKEATEMDSALQLNVVSEQPFEATSAQPCNALGETPSSMDTLPEMKEILERLGAPPPYPGKLAGSDSTSDKLGEGAVVSSMSGSTTATVPGNGTSNDIVTKPPQNTSLNLSQTKQSLITVKRSSSLGTPPTKNTPALPPPRKETAGAKQRASTFNLDTVVPISKPGMVRFVKDSSDTSTSVLRTESKKSSSVTGSDSESMKCLSEKDQGSGSERSHGHDDRDEGSDHLASLHEYSIGSDSDSDHERNPVDGLPNMGPLKMAAMNGLTLSRSVVLSLMNDESRAPKDDRRKMLESKISEGQVCAEFEQIPKKSDTMECSVALASHNASRNRFKDVLPYDATRVKLTPKKDNPDGYINASQIKLTANDTKWLFIATQAPLANTVADFWQMVWENKVDVLAMLTPFQESGKSKCFIYWPQEPGPEHKQTYGEYVVELQFTDDSLCYLTSRIILRRGSQEHLVWHLQYTDWPDHGCPEDTYGFLGFLDEIESVARLADGESERTEKSPVVIHCSAGVGRTGVVILTMVMKWCLEHNHNVDLPKALLGIRSQRMHMVQTLGQYRFIHDTLIQYLKNTRLI